MAKSKRENPLWRTQQRRSISGTRTVSFEKWARGQGYSEDEIRKLQQLRKSP